MRRGGVLIAAALVVGAAPLDAQVGVRTAVLFESYDFDPGLSFTKVSEMTVPVAISYGLGRFGNLALSTGYASVDLTSANPNQLPDQSVTGLLDTEARLTVNLLPGRLLAIMTAAVPTGNTTIEFEELSILGAISSDIIGFSAANLGTGGNVGGGFAGAVPLGRWALGFGGTYRQSLSYTPVVGDTADLRPGQEFRLRSGLEGPLAQRTYLRVAGIFARRGKDQVGGANRNGVGNRLIGYASVNQGFGASSLTLYAFDVFRGDPQIESTAQGAAILPRGNLLAGGARLAIGVDPATRITPRVEYRVSNAAPPDGSTTTLERLGSSVRFGLDLRRRASNRFAVVLQGSAITGEVVQGDATIGFSGFRAALHLEVIP